MKRFSEGDWVVVKSQPDRCGRVAGVYVDRYARDDRWWARIDFQDGGVAKAIHEELAIAAPPKHGAPWTQEEDDRLMREVRRGCRHVLQLAVRHGRTEVAITSRLRLLCTAEARNRQRDDKVPSHTDAGSLFDYIRDQRSGFTRRAVRALWSDAGYVARQAAYGQTWYAGKASGFTAEQLAAAAKAAVDCFDNDRKRKEISAAVTKLVELGKREFARRVLHDFNAANVSTLLPKFYDHVLGVFHRELTSPPRIKLAFSKVWPDSWKPDGTVTDIKTNWAAQFKMQPYQWRIYEAMLEGAGRRQGKTAALAQFQAYYGTADFVSTTEEKKPMEKFYTVIHQPSQLMTKADAIAHAEKLARNSNSTYYVMEAVQSVSLVQPAVAVVTLKAPKAPRKVKRGKRK